MRPAGRLWRRNGLGVPKPQRGRPEGSYRLPVVVPLLTVERPREAPEGGKGRRLWCRKYDRCLNFAVARGWSGFDCGGCDVRDEVSEDERLLDIAGVRRLVAEVKP